MGKLKRGIISFILSIGIIMSVYPTSTVVEAASGITTAHIDAVCKHYGYVSGKYWTYSGNNSTSYAASSTAAGKNGYKGYSYGGGVQCWAFARFLMAKVTGVEVGKGAWKKINASSVSNLQIGDIVCNGDTVHTAVVYKNLGNGKYQFIQVFGGNGNKINIGDFSYYDSNNKPKSTNTLSGLKSHGLKYIYRYNGTVNPLPTVTNVKATCDSNGATIEFDIENVASANSVKVTAWSLADGWGIDKYKAYTTPSISGNHYTFRVNKSDFGNMTGSYKSNIFLNGLVSYRDLTYTIPVYDPIGNLDVIESLCGGKIIHIAGWAFDKDEPSSSLDIHVYVGGTGGNTSAFAAALKANVYRSDVNQAYGITGNHGFDAYIPTNKTGIQEVNIYAINIAGGVNNPLLTNGKQSFSINTNANHRWDTGKVTKSATCSAKGIRTYTCTVCGATKTEDIPATGSHTWDSGKITKQPTTTSTGVKAYTCTKCKTTKTETIPKLKQEKKAGVSYTTHIQSIGWQGVVRNGDLAGTVGDSKRLEAIKINLENAPYSGGIEYRTHVQTYGWQGWVKNGALSGTSGQAKRLEAIQIRLTGEMAKHYDVYYRIQVQSFGWLGWAKNGEYSGSAGHAKRLEAIQIVLVEKGKSIDRNVLNKQAKITSSTKVTDSTPYVAKMPSIHYQTHVQSYGWQDYKKNGEVSGTSGQAKRLEGIRINLSKPPYEGGIRYKTHVQSYGWQGWSYDGVMSGTSGQAKRLEAICIELTGEMAEHYDVYYRVHAQSYGWLAWAKNGQNAGTSGGAKRLEAIQIVLVEKGKAGPGKTYGGITSTNTAGFITINANVKKVNKDEAFTGVVNYCAATNSGITSNLNKGIICYWYMADDWENDSRYVVVWRSYTGAYSYFCVNKSTGETNIYQYANGVNDKPQKAGQKFNVFDYQNKISIDKSKMNFAEMEMIRGWSPSSVDEVNKILK